MTISQPVRIRLQALVISAAVVLAWWNSLRAPFTFDDVIAVTNNPSIRQLGTALQPPDAGGTTTGRPLLNLSLALNYAVSDEQVWSYHATNILIHAAAALLLFGLARRTLRHPACGSPLAGDPARPSPASRLLQRTEDVFPFILALLWALHPLQTESVTSVAQRSESLCGLWYLAVLYGLARATPSEAGGVLHPDSGGSVPSGYKTPPTQTNSRRWLTFSVFACLAGMATKEVMVTAPVVALLYDRTFLAGSFAAAWRQRRSYYLALAATWLLLAALVAGIGGTRGPAAGLGLGVTMWDYLLTQCGALVIYLKLSFWPHPLVMDYGNAVISSWREVWWQGLLVLTVLAATLWALWRRPAAGFAGACFFVILAPSSSFVPLVSQTIAEHRMYLPLAAVLALNLGWLAQRLPARAFLAGGLGLALAAGWATHCRNRVYLDERALWENVLAHRPLNARAHNNLGRVFFQQDQLAGATASFRRAVELEPANPFHQFNLGLAHMQSHRLEDALHAFTAAVRLQPTYFYAQRNLGTVLVRMGRAAEALPHFEAALAHDPAPAELYFHWGVALAQLGRWSEAISRYAECVRLDANHVEALANWGTALMQLNSIPEAVERFEAALDLRKDLPEIHFNLGVAQAALGRAREAVAYYAEAVRLDPNHAQAHLNLGIGLAQAGQLPAAIRHLETAVQLRPDDPATHGNLGVALALAGRLDAALAAYQAALRLQPGDAQAHYNVGFALLESGRTAEARGYFETAVRLRPNFPAAQTILERLRAMGP